jgi:hypothetical protein
MNICDLLVKRTCPELLFLVLLFTIVMLKGTITLTTVFRRARRFLHHHVGEVGGLGERTLGELGLASDAVVLVPESMPAIHAFAAMQQSGVSGTGIVGLHGAEALYLCDHVLESICA